MPMADSNKSWRSVVLVDSSPDGASLRPVHWYRVFAVASSAAEAGPGLDGDPRALPSRKQKEKLVLPRAAAGADSRPGSNAQGRRRWAPGPGLPVRGLGRRLASALGRGPVGALSGGQHTGTGRVAASVDTASTFLPKGFKVVVGRHCRHPRQHRSRCAILCSRVLMKTRTLGRSRWLNGLQMEMLA